MTPLTIAFYFTALFLSLILQLVLGGYAFRRRTTPGAVYFVMLALAVAGILLGFILSLLSTSEAGAAFWYYSVRYSLATLLAPLTIAFLLRLWQIEPWSRPGYVALLFVVPAITIALIVTNSLHGLFLQSFSFVPVAGMMVHPGGTPGPLLAIFDLYAALLGLLALALLAWRTRTAGPSERTQLALIAAALLLMILAPVVIRLSPLADSPLPWTPVVSTFASVLLFVAVVNQNIFDVPKAPRQMLIDRMDDLVVVLDTQNRIVEINPAAQRGLGVSYSQLVGTPIDEVLEQLQIAHGMQLDESGERGAITVVQNGIRSFFDARVTRLFGARETWLGSLIVLRDVTAQKAAESALAERERRYRALFDQTSDLVIIADLDGTVIDVNREALDSVGSDRTVVIGHDIGID